MCVTKSILATTQETKLPPKITIADHFSDLKDPRVERRKQHQLIDLIAIAICAVICGADSWMSFETYGQAKHQWLQQCLELPNGIGSHDTFARVFARLEPQQFQSCFLSWVKSVSKITQGEVIAIERKTLRHADDKGAEPAAIHLVSAWATANRLVLGQRQVEQKSNEITAIPELIKVLDLCGCIVTIDAMGYQQDIVKLITQKLSDYVISLKKNQTNLYKTVQLFREAISTGFVGFDQRDYCERESSHSRAEIAHL